jgi:hypothetical protein
VRLGLIIVAYGAGMAAAACRQAPARSPKTFVVSGERSVFTDSALHFERCEPNRPGESWRKVCTPKDQAVEIRRKP